MKRIAALIVMVALIGAMGFAGCSTARRESGAKTGESVKTAKNNQTVKGRTVAAVMKNRQKLDAMSFDFSMKMKGTGLNLDASGKMWIDGHNLKTQMSMLGQEIITIYDLDNGVIYSYNPSLNQATKMKLDQSSKPEQSSAESPMRFLNGIDKDASKILKTEMYDGARCTVVEGDLPKSAAADKSAGAGPGASSLPSAGVAQGGHVKMWVRDDNGFPVKVEMTTPNNGSLVMEYKNVKIGFVPPETFKLPEGATVIDFNQMFKQELPGGASVPSGSGG
ncbi:MAG: hypothetical protein M1335_05105 [Chloroflexi bacterium]|nr:hypothetical protein [Chloroflexota bacterium]